MRLLPRAFLAAALVTAVLPLAPAAHADEVPAVLGPGAAVSSTDGTHRLIMQEDGNLVLYRTGGGAVWSSGTRGSNGAYLVVQGDGNVVLYAPGGRPVWATATRTGAQNRVVLDSGVLEVRDATGSALWRSAPLVLRPGDRLPSPGGGAALVVQEDGNLVLYRSDGVPLWHTQTRGSNGAYVVVQGDGNVVLYAPDGRPLWTTATRTGTQNRLVVLDTGSVEVRTPAGGTLWRSGPLVLRAGERVVSPGGGVALVMQPDGNLVLDGPRGPLWSASSRDTGADTAVMQTDGNLVVYAGGRPVWHTGTRGLGARLAVEDDGRLVVLGPDSQPVWSSASSRGTPLVPPFEWQQSGVSAQELGWTWREGCPVGPEQLRAVSVRYVGPDGHGRLGRVVVHATAVDAVVRAFAAMHAARFPLSSVRPVAEFPPGDDPDRATGDANNTSAFNCRRATGSSSWSEHAYGLALDVNPVQNPYVEDGVVEPPAGAAYVDRRVVRPGMVVAGDALTRSFAADGWGWGGDWTTSKDWMHFSRNGR